MERGEKKKKNGADGLGASASPAFSLGLSHLYLPPSTRLLTLIARVPLSLQSLPCLWSILLASLASRLGSPHPPLLSSLSSLWLCSWPLDIIPAVDLHQSASPAEVVKPGWGGLGAPTAAQMSCSSEVRAPGQGCILGEYLLVPHTPLF